MMFRFLNSNVVKSVCMVCSGASPRAGQLHFLRWFGKSSSSFLTLIGKSAVARYSAVRFIRCSIPSVGSQFIFVRRYHKIRIENLPYDATEEIVLEHFSQFGMVLSVHIVRDQKTLKPNGRGSVVFAETNSFYDALNSQPQAISNQELSISPFKDVSFVLQGLSSPITSKSLHAYFSRYGKVTGSAVKKSVKGTNNGFVYFDAQSNLDESLVSGVHWIDGTQVNVVRIFPKELTMRVKNLSPSTTNESLAAHFSQFGGVIQSDVKKDRKTGKSRGFGFVCFASQQKLDIALSSLPHVIDGKEVKLDYETEEFRIFLTALPPNLTEDSIKQYFEQFGPVYDCKISRDKQTNELCDYGCVTFLSTEGVSNALAACPHVIQDKTVEVNASGYKLGKRKCLFVGGLLPETTSETLYKNFSKFGTLVNCRVKCDKITGKSCRYGYVTFSSVNQVSNAVLASPHTIDGKVVDVMVNIGVSEYKAKLLEEEQLLSHSD